MGRVTIYIGVTKLHIPLLTTKNLLGEIQTKIRMSGPHKVFKNIFCMMKRDVCNLT